jgi:hypothetical protein
MLLIIIFLPKGLWSLIERKRNPKKSNLPVPSAKVPGE